jgi:hypothetical protein
MGHEKEKGDKKGETLNRNPSTGGENRINCRLVVMEEPTSSSRLSPYPLLD